MHLVRLIWQSRESWCVDPSLVFAINRCCVCRSPPLPFQLHPLTLHIVELSSKNVLLVEPILPDYYTHYYKNACSKCVHVITIHVVAPNLKDPIPEISIRAVLAIRWVKKSASGDHYYGNGSHMCQGQVYPLTGYVS